MIDVTSGKTGWEAWSQQQANQARNQFHSRQQRLEREKSENDERLLAKAAEKLRAVSAEIALTEDEIQEKQRKKAIISAAIERARLKKLESENTKF
jgi:electron transport complex protein RnfB